jgi:hypothetical protein
MNFDTYKKILSQKGITAGEVYKSHSDMVMEATGNSDIQSKVCYIYDYYHDDTPSKNKGMTYENTTKTRIDAKFMVTQYNTLAKDQVEFHIMFKPSQKIRFKENDSLYYYEESFVNKYGAEFPIGLYIDIPDEKNIYRRWLVCNTSFGNQFIKYSVLPCNYRLQWIENSKDERYKRQMWGVIRSQNSYNSGLWTDYNFTSTENKKKILLPMNNISEKIFYTTNINGTIKNQRMILSALTPNPTTWQVSKIDTSKPFGLIEVTLYQDFFNPNTDYVNLETGEMYADYYMSSIAPTESTANSSISCDITSTTNTIKVEGSYKLLTSIFYNNS